MRVSTYFYLTVELTNRCQFSCLHCLRGNNAMSDTDLPLELYEKLLREAQAYRSPLVCLTGGEPTLHQDFEKILAMTEDYQYPFALVTNGWEFERIYPIVVRYSAYLHSVTISMDGAEEATHDMIRQQSGSFQKAVQACMICYRKHIPFSLSMTLNRANAHEVTDFLDLASKLGASEVNLAYAQLTRQLVSQHLALSPQERREGQGTLFSLDEQASIDVNPMFDFFIDNPIFPCQAMRAGGITVDYTGHVRFCSLLSGNRGNTHSCERDIIGSLKETSLYECHAELVKKAAEFQQEKIRAITQKTLKDHDLFPCFYCAKYFHKLDWLHDFPESEWNWDL